LWSGVIQEEHGLLEFFGRHILHQRAPARRVGCFARIDRQRPIRQDRFHILKTGEKQPPNRRI